MITLLLTGTALSCGGLFCDSWGYNATPVDQTAEEILFAVDKEAGEISTHVRIFYEGPADEFAWVVPVPGLPDLDVGTNALFAALAGSASTWRMTNEYLGGCYFDYTASTTGSTTGGTTGGSGYGASTGTMIPGVQVVATEAVGPYDTVILQANTSAALVDWLTINEYDLPPGFDPIIAPYVSPGTYFVALKLAKDKESGDLEPLVMTYPGTKAGIPITLTSIAATEDMRLRVFVLGEHRAVPENYLHVRLNPLAIDWWSAGENFEEIVGVAADEAGGHAFATEFAGDPSPLGRSLFDDSWDDVDLTTAPDAFEFLVLLGQNTFPSDGDMWKVLGTWIPVPIELEQAGVDQTALYGCPTCYEDELRSMAFDAAGAAADVETFVLAPRRKGRELLDSYRFMTRLTSSVSPVEMTVDPMFVFNSDMAEQAVGEVREATQRFHCSESHIDSVPRELETADGRIVALPSIDEVQMLGLSELELIDVLTRPAAAVIEQTGEDGEPVILVDNRPTLDGALDDWNQFINPATTQGAFDGGAQEFADDGARRGCGCATTSPTPTWLLFLLPLIAARRRTSASSG